MRQLIVEDVMKALDDREAREQHKNPRGFSSVGAAAAEALLSSLSIQEVDGNELEPIKLPDDCPECSSFDFSQYHNEDAGTPDLLKHHQQHLEKMGVKFGRDGYEVFDLHNTKVLFTIMSAVGPSYRGNIDGCVAPFGLMPSSAAQQCRVGFVHKQSPKQKQAKQALDKCSTEVGSPSASICLMYALLYMVQILLNCHFLHACMDGWCHTHCLTCLVILSGPPVPRAGDNSPI